MHEHASPRKRSGLSMRSVYHVSVAHSGTTVAAHRNGAQCTHDVAHRTNLCCTHRRCDLLSDRLDLRRTMGSNDTRRPARWPATSIGQDHRGVFDLPTVVHGAEYLVRSGKLAALAKMDGLGDRCGLCPLRHSELDHAVTPRKAAMGSDHDGFVGSRSRCDDARRLSRPRRLDMQLF